VILEKALPQEPPPEPPQPSLWTRAVEPPVKIRISLYHNSCKRRQRKVRAKVEFRTYDIQPWRRAGILVIKGGWRDASFFPEFSLQLEKLLNNNVKRL
jgi:hypothetical protein